MKILGHKIIIHQGEDFAVTFDIRDELGAPYVPLRSDTNPFVQISIASAIYPQARRYKRSYWIDCSSKPKFVSDEIIIKPSSNPSTAYENVYYDVDEDGNRSYMYWNGSEYVNYNFSFYYHFRSTDTRDWNERQYTYEVLYKCGQTTISFLTDLWKSLYVDGGDAPTSEIELYWQINKKNPCLLRSFNISEPICNITKFNVLQQPSRIFVQALA